MTVQEELNKLVLINKKFEQLVTEKEKRISELDAINKHHQKLNGDLRKEYDALKKAKQNLRTKVEQYQDKAAHYRRKGVL